MTRVTGSYDWLSGECELEVLDHATGSERVCAAVSGLVCALAGYLKNAEHSLAALVHECTVEPGCCRFRFSAGDEGCGAFLVTAIGLEQLAEEFPGYVQAEITDNIAFRE